MSTFFWSQVLTVLNMITWFALIFPPLRLIQEMFFLVLFLYSLPRYLWDNFWNWVNSMTLKFMKHFKFLKSTVFLTFTCFMCVWAFCLHMIYYTLCECVCLVLREARRGCQMPLDWGYRWLWAIIWVLGIKSWSSTRVAGSQLLGHLSNPQNSVLFVLGMLLRLQQICLLDFVLCISNHKTSSQ